MKAGSPGNDGGSRLSLRFAVETSVGAAAALPGKPERFVLT
jgi:hypothetical protein